MKHLGRLAAVLALGAALAIAGGFFGDLARPLDSLSHFRVYLCVLAVAAGTAALFLGRARSRIISGAALFAALFGGLTVAPFLAILPDGMTPLAQRLVSFQSPDAGKRETGKTLSLLQMNVLHRTDPQSGIATIRQTNADFVTLEEVSHSWREALADAADLYPHRRLCFRKQQGASVAILSKHPFVDDPQCRNGPRFLASTVSLPNDQSLTVAAQHLFWPWPRGQWWQLGTLRSDLAALPAPLVIGGDFNAVPWSAALQTYARLTGTRPVAGIGPSFGPEYMSGTLKAQIGLPIDNVLVSSNIRVLSAETLPATQSDHLPVLVRFEIGEETTASGD